MKIEKKHLPDLANIMNNYFKAYDKKVRKKSSGSHAG